jgi:Raf kinase inhibitor-like YbhB/YbcL family protein
MGETMRALVLAAVLALSSTAAAARMTISVPDFSSGRTVPMANVLNLFGCTGQNQSPAISWSGEPRGTQSFAVTVFDPDAPTGSGWWHWTVFDIPANVHSLPAGAGDQGATTLPAGAVQGRTDFGFSHYGGPCPPTGDRAHRYIVTVYAEKIAKLPDLDASSSGALVGFVLHFNTLAEAGSMGRYGRAK